MDVIELPSLDNDEKEKEGKPNSKQEIAKNTGYIKELKLIEKFFANYWNKWTSKFKFFVFPVTLIWIGIAIWRALSFKIARETVQDFPSDHWIKKLEYTLSRDFHKTSETESITVYLVWGISSLDRTNVDRWDPTDIGKIVYDDDFDMSSEANQQRLIDICNDLKSSRLVLNGQVTCWIQDFLDTQNGGNTIPQSNFYTQLEAYINTTTGQDQYNEDLIGYISGQLKFIRIKALSPESPDKGYEGIKAVYENWENLMNFYNSESGHGINKAYQSAGYTWAWFVTQRELVVGAVQGILISLIFAFTVLVLSTMNILIALYAIICIAGIIISVIATMQLLGWSFGVLEAISIVVIIGFSVDYVVHLANHYVESVYQDRYRRTKDALTGIGISIVSGAITTIGSTIFFLMATMLFNVKFAKLVLSTMLFSLYFSLVVFVCINHWIGPNGHFGNLKFYVVTPLVTKMKKLCRKSKPSTSIDPKMNNEPQESAQNIEMSQNSQR